MRNHAQPRCKQTQNVSQHLIGIALSMKKTFHFSTAKVAEHRHWSANEIKALTASRVPIAQRPAAVLNEFIPSAKRNSESGQGVAGLQQLLCNIKIETVSHNQQRTGRFGTASFTRSRFGSAISVVPSARQCHLRSLPSRLGELTRTWTVGPKVGFARTPQTAQQGE